MSVDGTWSIVVKSPMGDMPGSLTVKAEGGVLTGTQSGQGATNPITNGKADGDNISWSAAITSPMPMTLEFTGAVSGNSISGTCKAGAFGSFPFSGTRA